MPTDVCPNCQEPIGHIVWKDCPRCLLPTDASETTCQNCSATFDSLFDDQVVPDAVYLYLEDDVRVIGVVSHDIETSAWAPQEDIVDLMIDVNDAICTSTGPEELEVLTGRLMSRLHYWLWVARRGGTAIHNHESAIAPFESVVERLMVVESLAVPIRMKMAYIARCN